MCCRGAEQHLASEDEMPGFPLPSASCDSQKFSTIPKCPLGAGHPRLRATGQGSFTHRLIKKKKNCLLIQFHKDQTITDGALRGIQRGETENILYFEYTGL